MQLKSQRKSTLASHTRHTDRTKSVKRTPGSGTAYDTQTKEAAAKKRAVSTPSQNKGTMSPDEYRKKAESDKAAGKTNTKILSTKERQLQASQQSVEAESTTDTSIGIRPATSEEIRQSKLTPVTPTPINPNYNAEKTTSSGLRPATSEEIQASQAVNTPNESDKTQLSAQNPGFAYNLGAVSKTVNSNADKHEQYTKANQLMTSYQAEQSRSGGHASSTPTASWKTDPYETPASKSLGVTGNKQSLAYDYADVQSGVSEKIPTYGNIIEKRDELETKYTPNLHEKLGSIRRSANKENTASSAVISYGEGVYSGVQEEPLNTAGMLAAGYVVGPVIGTVAKIPAVASVGAAASRVPVVGGAVKYVIPGAITAVYTTDIYKRVTEPTVTVTDSGEFVSQPSRDTMSERLGKITSTEILPFIAGAELYRPTYFRAKNIETSAKKLQRGTGELSADTTAEMELVRVKEVTSPEKVKMGGNKRSISDIASEIRGKKATISQLEELAENPISGGLYRERLSVKQAELKKLENLKLAMEQSGGSGEREIARMERIRLRKESTPFVQESTVRTNEMSASRLVESIAVTELVIGDRQLITERETELTPERTIEREIERSIVSERVTQPERVYERSIERESEVEREREIERELERELERMSTRADVKEIVQLPVEIPTIGFDLEKRIRNTLPYDIQSQKSRSIDYKFRSVLEMI